MFSRQWLLVNSSQRATRNGLLKGNGFLSDELGRGAPFSPLPTVTAAAVAAFLWLGRDNMNIKLLLRVCGVHRPRHPPCIYRSTFERLLTATINLFPSCLSPVSPFYPDWNISKVSAYLFANTRTSIALDLMKNRLLGSRRWNYFFPSFQDLIFFIDLKNYIRRFVVNN